MSNPLRSRKTRRGQSRPLHAVVSRKTLTREITLLQRAIFGLRKTYNTKGRVQELLDEARETLHFAKIEAEWYAANAPGERLPGKPKA